MSSPSEPARRSLRPLALLRRPSRRGMLKALFGAGAAAAALNLPGNDAQAAGGVQFLHGVASGDPLSDRVIIWTRPTVSSGDKFVIWAVSTNADMTKPVKSGVTIASSIRDWTVKVDVTGLSANTTYYYQFFCGGASSPIGKTKTAPTGSVAQAKFAVFSCANYSKGYFNVYKEAAKRTDLDAVLHLGDYFYEYGVPSISPTGATSGYVTPLMQLLAQSTGSFLSLEPRLSQLNPTVEITTLSHYRLRHALYRTDADLQELHRVAPWIVVWDDHESANDSYKTGADNHTEGTEGKWADRLSYAVQAYYEWLPVREPASGDRTNGLYRAFDWGTLAKLIMVDTRITGRDKPPSVEEFTKQYQTYSATTGTFPDDKNSAGQAKAFLGTTQEAWITTQVTDSRTKGQTWQIFGNQTLFHLQPLPDFTNTTLLTATQKATVQGLIDQLYGAGFGAQLFAAGTLGLPNLISLQDSWAGYPTARTRFYSTLAACTNPIILSGDSHNAWAADLRVPVSGTLVPIGVEIATPAVSSPGYEQSIPDSVIPTATLKALLLEAGQRTGVTTDRLYYAETASRGYMLVDVTPSRVKTDWIMVSTVFSTTYSTFTDRSLQVTAGAKKISEVA